MSAVDHKEVRFTTPSQEPPFPQPTVSEIYHNDHNEASTQPPGDSRHPFTIPRIPVPSASVNPPSDHEESLNLAAAREITREMDSLPRPAPQERVPSPLVPPALPFANRSVSPGPPSPRGSVGEDLVPPRIPLGERSRSGSGGSLSSPITRGMDFPSPPAGRTISAAAFKTQRGSNRPPNADELRKRTLPSSPYPPHRLNSTSSIPAQEDNTNPPPTSFNGATQENETEGRSAVRQSMDVPPSYKSVDDHNGY